MEKTGNDAGTVMKHSGHKTIESFSSYLRPTDKGRILATHAMENVDGFLTASSVDGVNEVEEGRTPASQSIAKSGALLYLKHLSTQYARLAQWLGLLLQTA